MISNLPWWAWPVAAVVCSPLALLTFLWLRSAFHRIPLDTDLWEGGDPDTVRLESDGSLFGPACAGSL